MHTHIYYLTPEENTVLNLIAEGITTKHILAKCPMPPSGFHIFCAELKRKTGISGKLSDGIGPFMGKYSMRIPANAYSSDHLRALRQFLTGQRYFSFMPPAEFQAMLTEACEVAAIFTTDERARKSAIRLFLALFHYNGKPLSPLEEQILRAMADGLPFEVITTLIPSQRTTFVKFKAREACQRLYFDAPGRNAQRNLLRAYFAWVDAHQTNPMDDPMF